MCLLSHNLAIATVGGCSYSSGGGSWGGTYRSLRDGETLRIILDFTVAEKTIEFHVAGQAQYKATFTKVGLPNTASVYPAISLGHQNQVVRLVAPSPSTPLSAPGHSTPVAWSGSGITWCTENPTNNLVFSENNTTIAATGSFPGYVC
jgi:hypothetical protein